MTDEEIMERRLGAWADVVSDKMLIRIADALHDARADERSKISAAASTSTETNWRDVPVTAGMLVDAITGTFPDMGIPPGTFVPNNVHAHQLAGVLNRIERAARGLDCYIAGVIACEKGVDDAQ